ncbi:hypothetical protein OJAV_G00186660 [Oryzias javanicus]|uniref:Uncharacterized protein n=1 Tax=Oryzias javanicus TaxID=123683 RepID=A0A437C9K8_ORYJA|nr:hypothetical protein OJAV_G00186660 [Oryzias javanicus]
MDYFPHVETKALLSEDKRNPEVYDVRQQRDGETDRPDDVQQLLVIKVEDPLEWSSSSDQQNQNPVLIKEELEDVDVVVVKSEELLSCDETEDPPSSSSGPQTRTGPEPDQNPDPAGGESGSSETDVSGGEWQDSGAEADPSSVGGNGSGPADGQEASSSQTGHQEEMDLQDWLELTRQTDCELKNQRVVSESN